MQEIANLVLACETQIQDFEAYMIWKPMALMASVSITQKLRTILHLRRSNFFGAEPRSEGSMVSGLSRSFGVQELATRRWPSACYEVQELALEGWY